MKSGKIFPVVVLSSLLVACGGGTGAAFSSVKANTSTDTGTGSGSSSSSNSSTGGSSTGSGSSSSGTDSNSSSGSDTGSGSSTGSGSTTSTVKQLARNAVDADYSDSLERLITASSSPDNALNIINPTTGEQQAVPLNLAPTSLALSPDGKMAVVGHANGVTYINLQTASVVGAYNNIGFTVFDIALDANGMAYATPTDNVSWAPLKAINLATGEVKTGSQINDLAGSYLQFAPAQKALYILYKGAVVDLEKADTSVTPPVGLYDSPYNGDYDMGGADAKGFWITEDGGYLLTAGETLFRTATSEDQDMLFQRSLADSDGDFNTTLMHADSSQEAGQVAVILNKGVTGTSSDYRVKTYSMPNLVLVEEKTLTDLKPSTSTDPVTPQFVFFNSDGSKRYVVLKQGDGTYLRTL